MKDLLALFCAGGFLLLPLMVLILRALYPRWMPWWAVCLVTVGLGWALAFVSAMLREGPDTGAGHVGALFFGWALALLWFLPWLLVYGVIQLAMRRAARRATQNDGTGKQTEAQ
jgi:hypothetical protein